MGWFHQPGPLWAFAIGVLVDDGRLLSDIVPNSQDSASAVAARLRRSYNGSVCRIEIILAKIDWKVRISSRQEKMSNLVKCLLTPVIILTSVYSCAADQWRQRINGVQVWLDSSQGIALHGIGDTIASDAGRLFGVCVGDSRLYSDEVRVRSGEVINMATSLRIPFDLPNGLGCGVLSLTAGAEQGVIDAGLSLTAGRTAEWRVLFPLLEKLNVDGISHDKLEFICADQAEQYHATRGGHAFVEWYQWWNHGEKLTAGRFAGSLHPFAGMGDYRLEPSWGGLPAYRKEIERCHDAGARVCLYILGGSVWKTSPIGREHAFDWGVMRTPGKVEEVWSGQDWSGITTQFWDMCSEAVGWQQFLRDTARRVLTETGPDAVRLDTKAEAILCRNPHHPHADDPLRGLLTYLRTIRQGVDKAGPDKALMGEFAGSDAAAQYFDATLAQGHDIDAPLSSQMTASRTVSRWSRRWSPASAPTDSASAAGKSTPSGTSRNRMPAAS